MACGGVIHNPLDNTHRRAHTCGMKHIEHATAAELSALAYWDEQMFLAKVQKRVAAAEKRAIAERCRARANRHKEGKP